MSSFDFFKKKQIHSSPNHFSINNSVSHTLHQKISSHFFYTSFSSLDRVISVITFHSCMVLNGENTSQFSQSPIDRYLGCMWMIDWCMHACIHLADSTNSTKLNSLVHISFHFWPMCHSNKFSKMGLLCQKLNALVILPHYPPQDFCHFAFPTLYEISHFPPVSPVGHIVKLLDFCQSNKMFDFAVFIWCGI